MVVYVLDGYDEVSLIVEVKIRSFCGELLVSVVDFGLLILVFVDLYGGEMVEEVKMIFFNVFSNIVIVG